MVANDAITVDDCIYALDAAIANSFPGIDYNIEKDARGGRMFQLTMPLAELERKYFTCKEMLRLKRFWQLVVVTLVLAIIIYKF